MKVAICDDDPVQARFLCSVVRNWAGRDNRPITIEAFGSASEFLFEWREDKSFDVLFLDIQMPGLNGMDLARTIREKDDVIQIIFVTGYSEYMPEGYEVSALHYLVKPVKEDQLVTCLDKALKRVKTETRALLIAHNGENIRIHQEDIVYIEAYAHSVVISTLDQRYETKTGIGEFPKRLDSTLFCNPHRSYIVGIRHIRKIERSCITLDNNVQIPVSRRRYSELNQAFIKFHKGGS